MKTKVMSSTGLTSPITFIFGALLMIVVNPTTVSATLCERRCETAVPNLVKLKLFWHRLSKREGSDDISFTHFIQILLDASGRYSKLTPLKRDLVLMVIRYKDCVKACEHQHSKRGGNQLALHSYIPSSFCIPPYNCR